MFRKPRNGAWNRFVEANDPYKVQRAAAQAEVQSIGLVSVIVIVARPVTDPPSHSHIVHSTRRKK
jgi:hypothetical protein